MKHLAFLFLLISCSSVTKNPDSGNVPQRIGLVDENRPNFYIHTKIPKQGRMIASVQDDSLNNKQVYFLSLYQQVRQLQGLIGAQREENACPGFHHELVSFKDTLELHDKNLSLVHDYKAVLANARLLPAAPMMSLPYEGTDVYHYLMQNPSSDAQQVVEQALTDYTTHLQQELDRLCAVGSSSGYYVYENFISFAGQDQQLSNDVAKLSAALKIPVFANMLIIEGLKHHNPIIDHTEVVESALHRANVGWLKNYLYELGKLRQHESKMSLLQPVPAH